MSIIDLDEAFYIQSDGGVTFSGGEPMAQPEMLAELLALCKARGYHTTLDTCGYASWETFESVLPDIDLVMYDLKLIDPELHRRYTGVSNDRILSNLRKIAESGKKFWVRVPIIPGITDTPENLSAIAKFLSDLPKPAEVHLLPYHDVAKTKYNNLGKAYKLGPISSPTDDDLLVMDTYFEKAGIPVQHGG